MKRIVLSTDFSTRSDRALRRAVILARKTGARIDLVHVVDDDRPQRIVEHEVAEARLLIAELGRSIETIDGVTNKTQVVVADPCVGIARTVEEIAPDLLVMGSHRPRILRDAFVGTTAERTIRSVTCPVLMVNGPPVGDWRHVLLTTDLSDHSRKALCRFAALGIGVEGRLSILSVYDAPALALGVPGAISREHREAYLKDLAEEAGRDLRAFLHGLQGVRAEPIVRHGETTVANEVLKTVGELRSGLIMVGSQGKGPITRTLFGSVAQEVMRSSSVDVLSIDPDYEST